MEGYLGQIILFAGFFAPKNWAECNGQEVDSSTCPALCILVTEKDASKQPTFKLPKLDAPAPGLRYIICVNGEFPHRS